MTDKIASEQFESTLDYTALPKAKLLELYSLTLTAHRNFFHMWQQADIPPYRDDTAHACKWEYWL